MYKLIKGSSGYFIPGKSYEMSEILYEAPCEFEYEMNPLSTYILRLGDILIDLVTTEKYEIYYNGTLLKGKEEPFRQLLFAVPWSYELKPSNKQPMIARYKICVPQLDISKCIYHDGYYYEHGLIHRKYENRDVDKFINLSKLTKLN